MIIIRSYQIQIHIELILAKINRKRIYNKLLRDAFMHILFKYLTYGHFSNKLLAFFEFSTIKLKNRLNLD
jgi:hypothetical protein